MKLEIVCPSRKRAENVQTKKWIKGLILIVRSAEVKSYEKHNPECRVIGTPKGIDSIAKTRQWILENFKNVFMIDDDVEYVRRFYTEEAEPYKIEDPDVIREIIERDAHIAEAMGAKAFGYTYKRRPVAYRGNNPYIHTGYLSGSHTGFLEGRDIAYSSYFSNDAEDHYISCIYVYKHRYALINTMIGFVTSENFHADGGLNDSRTIEEMKKNTLRLRKLFGECVLIKKPTSIKKSINLGERSVSFPI